MSDGTWERYAEDRYKFFRHDPAAGGNRVRPRPPRDEAPVRRWYRSASKGEIVQRSRKRSKSGELLARRRRKTYE